MEKRLNEKGGLMKCRQSCVQEVPKGREAKPGWVEPESPTVKSPARRSILEAATP